MPAEASTTAVGSLIWFDFPIKNFEKTNSFYTELFGWTFELFKESPDGNYWNVHGESGLLGGVYEYPEGGATGLSGVMYFVVPSVDEALEKAVKLGGEVRMEKKEIPDGGGVFAHIVDLSGNIIGVWSQT